MTRALPPIPSLPGQSLPDPPLPGRLLSIGRPVLPPLDRYIEGLREIWDSHVLSNGGPMLARLEARLAAMTGGPVIAVVNGALALELALEALAVRGEVVTTPFSFVASANAIARMGCRPVFADIEPRFLTLDPAAVEAAITPRTSAILAVHVFGMPCDHAALAGIAQRHGLRLIYDAAHAFGVTVDGVPIGDLGDATMFSLHATKPFHAGEGGLLTCADPLVRARIAALLNHGLDDDGVVTGGGTNAKMGELHALLGLLMLDEAAADLAARSAVGARYRAALASVPGIVLPALPAAGVTANHSYFVIRVVAARFGRDAGALASALAGAGIRARRYFHPSLDRMPAYAGGPPMPRARAAADEVLALPIGGGMTADDAGRVADAIARIGAGLGAGERAG